MRKVKMLNRISVDGYFAGSDEASMGMDWFIHDPKVDEWAHQLGGKMDTLLLGGKTYRLFEHFWVPVLKDPHAQPHMKETAEELTNMTKVVFSRTIQESSWDNTEIIHEHPVETVRQMKELSGSDILVLGSGSIVHQLSDERLIDEYIFIVTPVVVGKGKLLFPHMEPFDLHLKGSRSFDSGNVVLHYEL